MNLNTKQTISVAENADFPAADTARRQNVEDFRQVLENSRDVIYRLNLKTRNFDYVSPATVEISGYSAEELAAGGLSLVNSLVHPDDWRLFVEYTERVRGGGDADNIGYSLEYRFKTKEKGYRWLSENRRVVRDAANSPLAIIATARDVTEQKTAQAALHFQKTLLESQSEASIDGILIVSTGGEIISHNGNFLKMWEIPEAVIGGSDEAALRFVSDKMIDPDEFLDAVRDLYSRPDEISPVEVRLKDERVFERYSVVVRDASGNRYGRVWYFRDITERRKTEEKLRESEARYRLLFDSNPLPMWVYAVETLGFLAVNDAAVRHYGYTREEFLAMTIRDIRPPEDVPALLASISKIIGGEKAAAGCWRHRRKNGEIIDVDITSHELVFAGRRAELVLANDTTERKKAEQSIRFQAHLLNTVEQAVVGTDLDRNVIYWNRFAEKLYGWTAAEAVGRSLAEMKAFEVTDERRTEILSGLSAGESWTGETVMRHKNGAAFPAQLCASPVNDADGALIGIVGIATDITERRQAEEALRLAEAKYRNLVEMSPVIVYLAEPLPPYAPIYVSPNVETFGYPADEWFDRDDMWLSLIHEEDRARVLEITEDAMNRGLNTELEYRIVGRGGETYWVHDKGCFTSDEDGNKVGWQGVILDITKTKKLEQQLRQSQKLESVGRLAGGIAHDFNNMLTAINGYSELTLRKLAAGDPLRCNIEEIKKAGERSAQLTHQLLAFSRQQVLQSKIIDLNEVILDTAKMLKRLIGEDVHLQTMLDPQPGRVAGDPGQLAQVIMNLAVNARDAMPKGGSLVIETKGVHLDDDFAARYFPTQPGSYVLLAVTDTGVGIESGNQEHIFEPFYTTKAVGKGTGLGLATVYGIVKQSGGYIWVDSELGKGTTFRIYLPCIDEPVAAENETVEVGAIPRGRETVLVVEDEDMVRNLTRRILEQCGYRVIEASGGGEALSIIEKDECAVDLVLTDLVMPQMGGRELAEKLAEQCPQMRVLFTSGYTDDEIIRRDISRESADFIQKPFTFDALARKVRESLDSEN